MNEYKYTAKEEKFCLEVATGVDEFQKPITYGEAYKRAYNASGMKQGTIDNKASVLMAKDKIRVRVDALKAKVEEKCIVDAAYVRNRLYEIDQMDAIDIMEDDGTIKPIREWPKVWRQYLSGIEVVELSSMGEDDDKKTAILKKIKWPDKVRNLELLGKLTSVGAFSEKVDHTSSDGSMSPKRELSDDEVERELEKRGLRNPFAETDD